MVGKNVLVTGGSRGLGASIAKRFLDMGATVYTASRTAGIRVDFQREEAPYILAQRVRENIGHVDVLVNNAAVEGPMGNLYESDLGQWERCIRINLLTPALLCALLIPAMPEGSVIVNIADSGANSPWPQHSAYSISKAGIIRLTETLAVECGGRVRVNAVAPGNDPDKAADMVVYLASERAYGINGRLINAEDTTER